MSRVVISVVSALVTFYILMWLLASCTDVRQVYIGPVMQTSSGEYFCTFEDKQVFQEYMMEISK